MNRPRSLAAALAFVVLLLFGARNAMVGRREYAEAEAALTRGDERTAIAHLRRSARLVAPFSASGDALRRLRALALAAEGRSDADTALSAWRAVRGSVLATRTFFPRGRDALDEADEHLAALLARSGHAPSLRGLDEPSRVRAHLAMLRAEPRERAPLVLLASASFLAFVVCVHSLLVGHLGRDERPTRRRTLFALAAFAVFVLSARFA